MKTLSRIFTGLTIGVGLLVGSALIPQAHAEESGIMPISDTSNEKPVESTKAPSISILPTQEYVSLKAGNTVEKELTISNDGESAYSFKLYAQPYTIDDSNDSYTFVFNTMNSYTSIYNWVSFRADNGSFTPTATYRINPGEKKKITFRVTSPSAVPAGGQYAAIFAETINEEASTGSINGIYTVSRVALLLYGRSTEGVINDSEISSYEVPGFLLHGPITGISRVKSLGNVDVTTTYKLVVSGIFGNQLYSNTWSYPVLPGTERYVAMTWEDTPGFGIYHVQFTVNTGDHLEDHSKLVIVCPIYMIIVILSLLTAIIIWAIIVLKKRKERKSRLIV